MFIYDETEALSLQSSLWPPPGPQDGLGQGGLRLKWAKGRFWSTKIRKKKNLRMGLPIVENLSGPQESIFNLFRGPQLQSVKKYKNWSKFIKLPPLPLLAHVGPMAVWVPWAAVIQLCVSSQLLANLDWS